MSDIKLKLLNNTEKLLKCEANDEEKRKTIDYLKNKHYISMSLTNLLDLRIKVGKQYRDFLSHSGSFSFYDISILDQDYMNALSYAARKIKEEYKRRDDIQGMIDGL